MNKVIECNNLGLTFSDVNIHTQVLKGLNLVVSKGENVAILGSSGSGKSSLLNLLGGIDIATDGQVYLMGENLANLNETTRCKLRNEHLGFIYQFHHLMNEFSAVENVMLPLLIKGINNQEARKQATNLLSDIKLGHRLEHKPNELSGGERQRVAICRALITKPSCVLADEPTGNLDKENAQSAFAMMLKLNKQQQSSLIIVTHDEELAKQMDKILTLENGVLV